MVEQYIFKHLTQIMSQQVHTKNMCTMNTNGSNLTYNLIVGGSLTTGSTISCNSISLSNACIVAGNVGIKNSAPWVDLNLGNVAVGGSSGSLVFGKNNGAGAWRYKKF